MRIAPLGVACLVTVLGGCAIPPTALPARGWVADYDSAEANVHATGRPLLIHYRDTASARPDRTTRRLEAPVVRERTAGFVRCRLFRAHEPDRRYVAQFGVERAPALIVLHPDGTYHARAGALDESEIVDFLAQAQPPGGTPDWDPYIPRAPVYRWHRDLAGAQAEARRRNRPILVVLHRAMSGDWPSIARMLHAHEVYVRTADLVHCRLPAWLLFTDSFESPFGTLKLPAVVLVRPDGSFEALETPSSSETLARFIDRRIEPQASAGDAPAGSASGSQR